MFSKDNSKEGIAVDAASTVIEEGVATALENMPAIAQEASKIIDNPSVNSVIQSLAGGIIGAIAPSVFSMGLTFQQKRFERNVTKCLQDIYNHMNIIEERLNNLEPEERQKFINGPYQDALLDNIISENQEQKVQDNNNGFINLMSVENPNDDIVFTFFNTLAQMNELDIRVLRLYRPSYERSEDEAEENYLTIMKSAGIDERQYNFIREKLARLGMTTSSNEERRNKNLEKIGETLTELLKQNGSKNPKTIKPPKLEKIPRSDRYRITSLGRQFLSFIDEPGVDNLNRI